MAGVAGGFQYNDETGFRTDRTWVSRSDVKNFFRSDYKLLEWAKDALLYRTDDEMWQKNFITGELWFRDDKTSFRSTNEKIEYRSDYISLEKTPNLLRFRDDYTAFEDKDGVVYYRTDDTLLIIDRDKITYRTDYEVREMDGKKWKYTDDYKSYSN